MEKKITECATKKYIEDTQYFIKSTYYDGELQRDGMKPVEWKWGKERLLNEAAALQFIQNNTTIPSPAFVSCNEDENGALRLVVKRINGIAASEVGKQCHKPDGTAHVDAKECTTCKDIVRKNINEFVETVVKPQLSKFHYKVTGLNGVVIPHRRIQEYDTRDQWMPKEFPVHELVFCHGDLSLDNFMVDERLRVIALSDWENAGYYPP